MKPDEILSLKMDNSLYEDDMTLGDFFFELLNGIWIEGESFSGKRPFGNSGWQYDVYNVLVRHGLVPGILCNNGYVDKVNEAEADKFVTDHIIKPLFKNFLLKNQKS